MDKIKANKKTIQWTALGACLEWYEFSIFIYVTPMISKAFFPKESALVGLLLSFALFAIGYLMRPIGGMLFGNFGDKWGRKKVLVITTGMMMLPMLGTAILPTYQQWGSTAALLLLVLRMIQGLSVGGEFTSVLTMLMEHAPKKHRAFTTSLASIVSGLGVVISAIVVTLLTYSLSEAHMYAWGWRIPFAIGFLLSAYAFSCQLKLQESPAFEKAKVKKRITKTPFLVALKQHPKSIFYVFLMAGFLGIPCYIGLGFFGNYLINTYHMNTVHVMLVNSLSSLIYLPFIPLMAMLSDKIGRKPILLLTTAGFIIMAYPVFVMINSNDLALAFLGNATILILYGSALPVFVTMINELFPTAQRLSGVSTGYNVGNALFGGTTPLMCQYLINHTHNPLSPAWYLIGAAMITFAVVITMPETNPNTTTPSAPNPTLQPSSSL